jgi:TonB dependent receptor.
MASGLGWFISKERFFHSSWLSSLKLRVSYGQGGNIPMDNMGETTVRYMGLNQLVNLPFARMETIYNPELKWEVVNTMNAGIDFRINSDQLYGSFDVYGRQMKDLLGGGPVGITTGWLRNTVPRNFGEMRGSGVEVELNSDNEIGQFKLSSGFIANYNVDRVTKFSNRADLNAQEVASGKPMGLEAFTLYPLFSFGSATLDPATGDPRGYYNGAVSTDYDMIMNGTKVEDLSFAGSMLPKLTGSWRNALSWKRFTLAACMLFNTGYYFRRTSIDYEDMANEQTGHGDYYMRWKKKGDERYTTVPSLKMPDGTRRNLFYAMSEPLVTKGDHLRLQYVNLKYEVLKQKIAGVLLENIQVFAVVNDPFIIWKANKNNIDPDNQLMRARASFSFGTNITF